MISTLPTLYPEELLYSLCARYCDRMEYPSLRSVIQELFGNTNVIASVDLPSHIDNFVAALPPGHHYTVDKLIDNHTLLPFYGPFLPPDRLSRLRDDMRGSGGPAIHMRAGIMACHIPLPEWLRFCSLCVVEDRKRFGEAFWHRVHQVPGVEVCPLHEILLQNSKAPARNVITRYEFISAERALKEISVQPTVTDVPCEIFVKIARDAYWLLSQPNLSQEPKSLHDRYRRVLVDLNLATYRGRVDSNALLNRFRGMYSPELLNLLHCEIDERVNENWLLRLVRTSRCAQHTLHHLLLLHCLGHTAETFFSISSDWQPFGVAPWPCLNPTCRYYRQFQIMECQVTHSQYVSGKPIGTFSCTCGFTYSRTGPDTSTEDLFRLSKVKSFGRVWENRLRALWEDETVSLRGIAYQLGVDPLTVKRHTTRLGLPFPRPVSHSLPLKEAEKLRHRNAAMPESDKREVKRARWLTTMKEDPGAGVKILRSKIPGVYTWLYKNDLEWLKEHIPTRKKAIQRSTRVDWNMRDRQLAELVKSSAIRIKNAPGRPIRVTLTAIGRDISQTALLQQHLNKLPLTAEKLVEFVETYEEFAVRRIEWAAIQYEQEGTQPARWELIRRAGVDRLKSHNDVCAALDEAIQFTLKEGMDYVVTLTTI
jgi:hypothetical protein